MNHLIILSGGTGSRMKSDIPKQYIDVCGKPVIQYALECFDFSLFDCIVIVVADSWKDFVAHTCTSAFQKKDFIYAPAGASRQESILNGLKALKSKATADDIVVIHDAARACCTDKLVRQLIDSCVSADGAMPVLPVKDTIYMSNDGLSISSLLDRDSLFCGQAPEAFKFESYYRINESLSSVELAKVRGSSELAFNCGMKVALIEGDEENFKITTPADLERFRELKKRNTEK